MPLTPLSAASLTFTLVNDSVKSGPIAINPFIGIALANVMSKAVIAPPENPPIITHSSSMGYSSNIKL